MGWPTAAEVQARTNIAISEQGLTDYGLSVTELIASAKAHCESYCNREFDEAEVTEVHDGGQVIIVRRPPIVSVSKITVGGSELDASDYYVYPQYVRLDPIRFPGIYRYEPTMNGAQDISITYTGGYSDASGEGHIPIPAELKEIVLELTCRWLLRIDQQMRLDRNAARTSVGSVTAEFYPPEDILADLYRRLDKFKLVVI